MVKIHHLWTTESNDPVAIYLFKVTATLGKFHSFINYIELNDINSFKYSLNLFNDIYVFVLRFQIKTKKRNNDYSRRGFYFVLKLILSKNNI